MVRRLYEVLEVPKWPQRLFAPPFTGIIVLFASFVIVGAVSSAEISYSEHCNDMIPEPLLLPDPNPPLRPKLIALRHTYVYYQGNNTEGVSVIPSSLLFSARWGFRTRNRSVFKIEATLRLIGPRSIDFHNRRGLRRVHFRPPRIPVSSRNQGNAFSYELNGFWDWNSGKFCMIGSGLGKFGSENVVFKLNYLNSSNIFSSVVNGTFERVIGNEKGLSRNLISILGVHLRNYKYDLIDKEIRSNGFDFLNGSADVSLGIEDLGQDLCSYIKSAGAVELKYEGDCRDVNCNFFGGKNNNYTPSVMNLNEIECSKDGGVRFLIVFGNVGDNVHWFRKWFPFEPNATLVSEGKWDEKKRKLDMVGCHIFSEWNDGFVGECSIRLSLRFPSTWTLKERSSIVGLLWSTRNVNESGVFSRVSLSSSSNMNTRSARLKYEYTEIKNVKSSCANKMIRKGIGKFPDGVSSDLRFDMDARNRDVKDLWGYTSPIYVEDRPFQATAVFDRQEMSPHEMNLNHTGAINVSYLLSLATPHNFRLSHEYMQVNSFDISAEGLYDPNTGHLCMVGCMYVFGLLNVQPARNSSLDCEIVVNIQYPPISSKNRGFVKGTVESTRKKSDRLYFEPFEISSHSIYAGQAKDSKWRMDLEITMVLISNTLSCFFLCIQILYVKRNANVLPFISVTMLLVLTLAHLVPLLLNFEALFSVRRSGTDSYLISDGWVEVNEVLVRVITMIAFLLEFRLLQLSWCAKFSNENQRNAWISDKKVIYVSLPMYIGGALIAWFVHHLSKNSHTKPSFRISHIGYKQKSLWGDLKTYGGLILDGFLLPQIFFNLFTNTDEKALTQSFYAGTSFVRLLPHAYDLYRSHSSSWSFNYIYANPGMDYYSPTWDIIISSGCLLFVFLIYLQQQYGGGFLLPKRLRNTSSYEKMPVATGE